MSSQHPAPILDGAARATDLEPRTFATLDGLRGVAALAVVVWHVRGQTLFASGYLAVDLFFMLSGFVLAYRYERKLVSNGDAVRFAVMRAIRMYPLYILGSAMGAGLSMLSLLVEGGSGAGYLIWAGKCGAAIAMFPILLPVGLAFPFNVPAWSLFYELVINIVYGFINRSLNMRRLVLVVGMSAAVLSAFVLWVGHMRFTGEMPLFLLGSIRTIFGFGLGIILYRLYANKKLPVLRVHPIFISALLVLVMMLPRSGPAAPFLALTAAFLLLPFVMTLGILNEPRGMLAIFMRHLGLLSFPIYAVHYAVWGVVRELSQRTGMTLVPTALLTLALSIGVAWVALYMFDIPVRRWLTRLVRERWPRPAVGPATAE